MMTNVKNNSTMQDQTFIEKCYKDRHGKVTLAQKPNVPIIVWAICRIALLFVKTGESTSTLHNTLDIVAFGALFTWAWLELFDGANYARRLLGLVVLIYAVARLV